MYFSVLTLLPFLASIIASPTNLKLDRRYKHIIVEQYKNVNNATELLNRKVNARLPSEKVLRFLNITDFVAASSHLVQTLNEGTSRINAATDVVSTIESLEIDGESERHHQAVTDFTATLRKSSLVFPNNLDRTTILSNLTRHRVAVTGFQEMVVSKVPGTINPTLIERHMLVIQDLEALEKTWGDRKNMNEAVLELLKNK